LFKNKLTKLANLVQYQRMLMFCLKSWGAWAPCPFLSTPLFRAVNAIERSVQHAALQQQSMRYYVATTRSVCQSP